LAKKWHIDPGETIIEGAERSKGKRKSVSTGHNEIRLLPEGENPPPVIFVQEETNDI
jgi:hypothetical protein